MCILAPDALKGFAGAVQRNERERKLNDTFANHSGENRSAPTVRKSMVAANDRRSGMRGYQK